jgi:hypothetical protein
MSKPGKGTLAWVVVLVVGIAVVAIVLALKLVPRLSDGQKVLNAASPAFTSQRIAGDRAGVNMVSHIVDLADPLVTPQGGGAAEVPAVVNAVATSRHISPAQALAFLQKNFPHTIGLLEATPLSSVNAELPGLVAFVAKATHLTPAALTAALSTNFPRLSQAINSLPTVAGGWQSIPGAAGLTRFDGTTPVRSVPDMRTYLSADVVAAAEAQQSNFRSLNGTSKVDWIPVLLLIVGAVVILFSLAMIVRSRGGISRGEAIASSLVVIVVGVVVVALVLVLNLIPRLNNGQKLINGLKPALTAQRVAGDRTGVSMVSTIVNLADPIVTPQGGAAAEVPKLVAFVSQKSGLPPAAVVAALQKNFPHTAGLLAAIPLTAVTQELPKVAAALPPGALKLIPHLAQSIQAAPIVTGGWNSVPGTAGLTRFNGTPVSSVPDVRTYFSSDVIPVLETQQGHFRTLAGTSKIDFLGPVVLIVGIVTIVWGLLMVILARRREDPVSPGRPGGGGGAGRARTPVSTG